LIDSIAGMCCTEIALHDGAMPHTGKIVIEWEIVDQNPLYFAWSMRCDPAPGLENLTALCEQMARAHRDLLNNQERDEQQPG